MGTSPTEYVRGEIQEYLKQRGVGVKVRESELFKEILKSSKIASPGILRGIANKAKGIGGYVPIFHVEVVKEGNKSFYCYKAYRFTENSVLGELQKKVIEFKTTLQRDNLWNVSWIDLSVDERRPYLEFMNRFENVMDLFTAETNE